MEDTKAILGREGYWLVGFLCRGEGKIVCLFVWGKRRRTVCSFCKESSKLTAPRVALVTLSYDEGKANQLR